MKFKNINSAIHNFGHSFVSDMNYVDDDFIINDLNKIHKNNYNISINWLTGEFEPKQVITPRLEKSINYWRNNLEKHLSQQNVELTKINKLFYKWPVDSSHFMEAEDKNGKVYKIEITKTK